MSPTVPTPPPTDRLQHFVWPSACPGPQGETEWALFKREFTLPRQPDAARFALFGSHRYRLTVNDRVVGTGPVRYLPGTEMFDVYDLADYLVAGPNHILVECCLIRGNNYQSVDEPHGRFAAWGTIDLGSESSIDLATPAHWLSKWSLARSQSVPAFSFAIGPIEHLDVETLDEEIHTTAGWIDPVISAEIHSLRPRSLPYPSGQSLSPLRMSYAPLRHDERRFGLVSVHPESHGEHQTPTRGQHYRYTTFVHSPRDQDVEVGLYWGPHFINGQEVVGADDPLRGKRHTSRVTFRRGWNLWCGEPEQLLPRVPLLLGYPRGCGLSHHVAPDLDAPHGLIYESPAKRLSDTAWSVVPPASIDALNVDSPSWSRRGVDALPHCPAVQMAWDSLAEPLIPHDPDVPLELTNGSPYTAVLDFGTEYLGHVCADLEAPAGALVDFAYDERLREDGALGLFASHPFVESADRFVHPGGRVSLETFHPRGGRYLQITVRPPEDTPDPITIHRVSLRDARCLPDNTGRFSCDDANLNWTWDCGVESMKAGTEDTFCDSPWRERGTYLGDSYVQSLVHLVLTNDRSTPEHALDLFAHGQLDDGQIPCVVPGWLNKPHSDFSLIYILWLRDHWARTGDLGVVRRHLEAAEKVIRSATWETSEASCLWNATPDNRLFIDWGVDLEIRTLDENGVLNTFRYRALIFLAELYEALGQADQGQVYRSEASGVEQALTARLWNESKQRYASGRRNEMLSDTGDLHVNILALAFGLGDAEQQAAVADYVIRRMSTNAERAVANDKERDFAELYFLKFVLDGMVRIERFELAEQVIRSHMRPMRERGAWTFWECLHRGIRVQDSLCHSWASAPLEYFTRYVLGVREAEPGDLSRLIIEPCVHSVHAAEGVFPHPQGPVQVSWERDESGEFCIDAQGPTGVELMIKTPTKLAMSAAQV